MALYSDKVMDHFKNPRNVGEIPDADGVGEVGNAKCGDIMKIYLKIKDGKINDVKFETFGCASAIASSSMATELIKGKTVDEALSVSNKQVVDALDGLPAHKPRRMPTDSLIGPMWTAKISLRIPFLSTTGITGSILLVYRM